MEEIKTNSTYISRMENKGYSYSTLQDNLTERITSINQSELVQITTEIPRRSPSRFPPRLIQILISVRRACQDKMNKQPAFDKGNLYDNILLCY